MAVITSLVKLFRGQTESSDNPNPRTASQVLAASLTFSLTAPIFDSAGARPAQPFIVTFINRSDKKPLSIYVTDPSTELSADGLTITLASATQKNIDVSNTNSATSDFLSGTTPDFDLDQNSAFRISISALEIKMLEDVLTGNIGTGNTNMKLGDGTNGATQGFEIDQGITSSTTKYGADASGNPLITLPGGSSFIPGAAAGSISGGDGIDFTASVVSVDLTDTTTFVETTSGAGDSGKSIILDAAGLVDQANIEGWKDVTATATKINQALDGVSANVTDTNLNTLTAGTSSDADALHTHDTLVQRFKAINITRDIASASGSVNYAHGLGVTPKFVTINSVVPNSEYLYGTSDGTNETFLWGSLSASDQEDTGTNVSILLGDEYGSSDYAYGTITMNSTNIVIAWTLVGTPSSNSHYLTLTVFA